MTYAALPLSSSISFQKRKTGVRSRQPNSDRAAQKPQNSSPPRSRERGVVLTLPGWNRLQTAKAQAEFQENTGNRFTLEELSERTALSLGTVSKVLGRLEPVDRYSLQTVFQSFGLELYKNDYARPNSPLQGLNIQQQHSNQDWGEAMDVSRFCGRETELATLRQWLVEKRCRLLSVLGIGGIGKSTLAVKLASQIESEFEVVVWRSLQAAPSLEELLESILPFLLHTQGDDSRTPSGLDQRLAKLMDCLRSARCLLILDSLETLLASGDQSGRYRAGYEGYGQLLQRLGTVPHQSCVILTSREKPQQIALLEGEDLPVHSFRLGALQPTEGRSLFEQKGQFSGSEAEWKALIEHYGGQPLALKLVATATRELFNGRIGEVLKSVEQGLPIFEDIRDGLDRQFDRLSTLERDVMLWFAIHQEPVSLEELRTNLVNPASKRELPGALNSLLRRSLIEPTTAGFGEQAIPQFSLQPIVLKYGLERLIRQVCDQIKQQQVGLLRTHALDPAPARDRTGERQQNLILHRISEWLLTESSKSQQWLEALLEQQQASQSCGYTISNLQGLLMYCEKLSEHEVRAL